MFVYFDDELTTFRDKKYRFICNVKKIKTSFMECERDIGSIKTVIFKHGGGAGPVQKSFSRKLPDYILFTNFQRMILNVLKGRS